MTAMLQLCRPLAGRPFVTRPICYLRRWSSLAAETGADESGATTAGATAGQSQSRPVHDGKAYDIAIVGGGLVGTALACALGANPQTSAASIALIEPRNISRHRVLPEIPDARVSAINSATVQLFKDIGAWDPMVVSRVTPFKSMQVWETASAAYVRYQASDARASELGYIVENGVIEDALVDRAYALSSSSSSPLDILPAVGLKSIELPPDPPESGVPGTPWNKLELTDGSTVEARLVVAADGGKSKVREAAGIRSVVWAYDQKAIVATVRCDRHHNTAWQRFLPTGPVAILPLHDGYSSIVWSTSSHHAETLLSMDDDQFVAALTHALTDNTPSSHPSPFPFSFPFSLPFSVPSPFQAAAQAASSPFQNPPIIVSVAGRRLAFPLVASLANNYVRPRLALIGDAAHTVHPLAGQGVNLGYADVKALTATLQHGLSMGADIGSLFVLRRYEDDRKAANAAMVASMHVIQNVFDVQWGPFAALRSLGLSFVNSSPFLKEQIVRFASGTMDPFKSGLSRH